ncbi:hypothetical protein K435DRAFT_670980, partial [Dendrothele bispora CBS 962.96]
KHPLLLALLTDLLCLLKCYFPRLHQLYSNILDNLCNENPSLTLNFAKCCFAASSFNSKHTVTFPHHNSFNLLFGQCIVFTCGIFDYEKMEKSGHLVLEDLELIIELPPSCIILLSSTLFWHSNIVISPHKSQHTFFDWAHHHHQQTLI